MKIQSRLFRNTNRRDFLRSSTLAAAALTKANFLFASESRPPRILLRSSWQVVNIGDIAHTPGVLALLERYLPEAEVRLWASSDFSAEAAAMVQKRFPNLRIVKGGIDTNGKVSDNNLDEAIQWCDFLLHGSGPSMVAHKDVAEFVHLTHKPFGVYGITYGGFGTAEKELLSQARFVFFRDSVSLAKAQSDGIQSPVMEFGPDGAFAFDIRNDERAQKFLRQNNLEEKNFLCCIPRLRYTPYWKIHNRPMDTEAERRHARNEERKEHDHAPLRDAIAAVLHDSDLKILLCPEDKSQMEVGKEMLLDKLPTNLQKRVVWRENFWLTDEALSTYARSAGLFGLEMHSPIICIGNGIPAIVCRFAEQTSKGYMWHDIGLKDWMFDMDEEVDSQRIVAAVLSIVKNQEAAQTKVKKAQEIVVQRQLETMNLLKDNLTISNVK